MTNPSHIGQYRIVRKLGAGGMGLVFLGEHMLLGRRAAIKTLLPTVGVNHEIVERFFNEARAASAISDPGVIQIFDFGYHVDGTAYIVMELLEGEALSARIDRLGKLPVAEALRIARQIAGSLAAAHACNIVHRDLKPDNIFLVRDVEAQTGERTKILDFGICKLSARDGDVAVTQAGAMVGTPVYMSPEQCRGIEVDHRSDIYAFGCLLFHMLTGRPPFIGEASGDLIVAHMQADPPAPSLYVTGLPFEIDALVLRCLEKAPEDRFPSMNELHLVLGDIYAQLDTTESTVAAVTPAMQLGQGFRSVYDANLSRFAAGRSRISPTNNLRPPLRFLATPPGTPPKLPWTKSAPADTDDDELAALLRPRNTALRVVLAGMLITAVIVAAVVLPRLEAGAERHAIAGTPPVGAAPTETISELAESPPPEAARAAGMPEPAPPAVEAASQLDLTVDPTVDPTVERTLERASIASEPASEPSPVQVTSAEPQPVASGAKIAADATKAPPAAKETRSPPETKSPPETRSPLTTKGPVVSPAQVASASSKPAVNPKPTDAVDRKPASDTDSTTHVTTLTKPAAAPAQAAASSAPAPPPPAPPPPAPSPPRPPPSNEDLYDTR